MSQTITLDDIYAPVAEPVGKVPATILEILSTSNELSTEVIQYFFSGKGKLLRPVLTLLGAELLHRTPSRGDGLSQLDANPSPRDGVRSEALIRIAASFEIFHAATLIHDDIIDSAYLRRNLPTINTKWDAQTAVLVGDYLHDKAMGTLFRDGSREIFSLFLETAGLVCDGEIHELGKKSDFTLSEEEYVEIIRKKTSVLLACCLEAGARYRGATEEQAKALNRFGIYFGNAFQIVDDCLDFTGNQNEFGKTLGADLEAGVLTLPLIQLLKTVSESERSEIIHTFKEGTGEERLQGLLTQIREGGALDYAYGKAKEYCALAKAELEIFEPNAARTSLEKLLEYVLERKK